MSKKDTLSGATLSPIVVRLCLRRRLMLSPDEKRKIFALFIFSFIKDEEWVRISCFSKDFQWQYETFELLNRRGIRNDDWSEDFVEILEIYQNFITSTRVLTFLVLNFYSKSAFHYHRIPNANWYLLSKQDGSSQFPKVHGDEFNVEISIILH